MGDSNHSDTTPLCVTASIAKADYTDVTTTASANLKAKSGATVEVTLPKLPEGASYGTVTKNNTDFFTVGTIADGKVSVTGAKDWAETDPAKDFTVAVSGDDNHNGYTITVTVTPLDLEAEFENYLEEVVDSLPGKLIDGETTACKTLVDAAKAKLEALEYDEEETLENNKGIVDQIMKDLDTNLASARTYAPKVTGTTSVKLSKLGFKIVKNPIAAHSANAAPIPAATRRLPL